MTRDQILTLYRRHLAAEGVHDAEAAADTYGPDGYYEYVPLGLRLVGREAVAFNYANTFTAMPDMAFTIEGELVDGDQLMHWGVMGGTVSGPFFGQPPTGRSVSLPFVARIEFGDEVMLGETIWFDLATLCEQAGLELAAVQQVAVELRAALAPMG